MDNLTIGKTSVQTRQPAARVAGGPRAGELVSNGYGMVCRSGDVIPFDDKKTAGIEDRGVGSVLRRLTK